MKQPPKADGFSGPPPNTQEWAAVLARHEAVCNGKCDTDFVVTPNLEQWLSGKMQGPVVQCLRFIAGSVCPCPLECARLTKAFEWLSGSRHKLS